MSTVVVISALGVKIVSEYSLIRTGPGLCKVEDESQKVSFTVLKFTEYYSSSTISEKVGIFPCI